MVCNALICTVFIIIIVIAVVLVVAAVWHSKFMNLFVAANMAL